jgi:hypothetical protein
VPRLAGGSGQGRDLDLAVVIALGAVSGALPILIRHRAGRLDVPDGVAVIDLRQKEQRERRKPS